MIITSGIIEHVQTYQGKRAGGVDAVFTPINLDWGFKHYYSRNRAMVCYARQKWGHQFGLGPQVGGFVKFGKPGREWYGFITERLRPFSTWKKFDKVFTPAFVSSLEKKLGYIGFSSWCFDFSKDNIGFDTKNTIKIIDWGWGAESTPDIHDTDIADILSKHGYNIDNYVNPCTV